METEAPMPRDTDLPILQAVDALQRVLTGFRGVLLSFVGDLEKAPVPTPLPNQLQRLVAEVIVPALQRLETLRNEWACSDQEGDA
jgi:hypothetical protein